MNIIDLLEHLEIPHCHAGHANVSHGFVGVDCPQCSGNSQHWRLGINLAYNYATCWVCGRTDLLWALVTLSHRPYRDVKELLGGVATQIRQDKPRGVLKLPEGLGPLKNAHRRYLKRRGVDPDYVEKVWGVRGIGPTNRHFPWSIFIPIHRFGKLVSWTTRSMQQDGLRYHSASASDESWPHHELVMGADLARHALCVVEGPIDVYRIGMGAGCTFGTGYSLAQLKVMASFPERIICFDAQDDAQLRARKLCQSLAVFPGRTRNIVLESGKDPGEASDQEIKAIRKLLGVR